MLFKTSFILFSSKIYDKRDDFDIDLVNFPVLDGNVPRRPSYGVYISQLIRFARVCILRGTRNLSFVLRRFLLRTFETFLL